MNLPRSTLALQLKANNLFPDEVARRGSTQPPSQAGLKCDMSQYFGGREKVKQSPFAVTILICEARLREAQVWCSHVEGQSPIWRMSLHEASTNISLNIGSCMSLLSPWLAR